MTAAAEEAVYIPVLPGLLMVEVEESFNKIENAVEEVDIIYLSWI